MLCICFRSVFHKYASPTGFNYPLNRINSMFHIFHFLFQRQFAEGGFIVNCWPVCTGATPICGEDGGSWSFASPAPSPRVERGIVAEDRPTTLVAPLHAALDAAAQRPYHLRHGRSRSFSHWNRLTPTRRRCRRCGRGRCAPITRARVLSVINRGRRRQYIR